jgi:hypothetical protein
MESQTINDLLKALLLQTFAPLGPDSDPYKEMKKQIE